MKTGSSYCSVGHLYVALPVRLETLAPSWISWRRRVQPPTFSCYVCLGLSKILPASCRWSVLLSSFFFFFFFCCYECGRGMRVGWGNGGFPLTWLILHLARFSHSDTNHSVCFWRSAPQRPSSTFIHQKSDALTGFVERSVHLSACCVLFFFFHHLFWEAGQLEQRPFSWCLWSHCCLGIKVNAPRFLTLTLSVLLKSEIIYTERQIWERRKYNRKCWGVEKWWLYLVERDNVLLV